MNSLCVNYEQDSNSFLIKNQYFVTNVEEGL